MSLEKISILGSGWLGKPLAQHLYNEGYSIRVSTTSKDRIGVLESLNLEPYVIDIANVSAASKKFFESTILIINITSKDIAAFRRLISEIETSHVAKVVFVSSTSVYGSSSTTITESKDDALLQGPLHEIEKLFLNNQNFRTTVVRFGGLIGYSRNPGNFFRGGKIVRYPDAPVNLIHRDDCIGIISRIIENQCWGEVFNCCADTHPTKREFYTRAAKAVGQNAPEFSADDDKNFKIISNEKVKKLLDYEFIHPDLMAIKFS